jgi:kumamolisin
MSDSASNLDDLKLSPLPGSERAPAPGVTATTKKIPADALIEATLILRRKAEVPPEVLENRISPARFAERYGADPADVELVVRRLSELGATIVESSAAERRVRISGPSSIVSRIFGATLADVTSDGPFGTTVSHRHRTGLLSVPSDLSGIVTSVLGLDDRPQASALFRIAKPSATATSYTPPQLGTIYDFPADTDGSGQTVAIIELGGGYAQSDLDAYFAELGIPTPNVTAVGVDGGTNVAGKDPNGADGEVLLDIEVIGSLAPGADIVVYFAPNTDAGFVDAVTQAAHATPTPVAISISWGQSEDEWTADARTSFDDALVDAAALGVTVTAAAGDDGSSDNETDGAVHVDFPASSPHALACGGTTLEANATTGKVKSETVWNNGTGNGATGGGVSDTFPLPAWQDTVGVPTLSGGKTGRGVPDVSAVADPQTGYKVRVDGKDIVIGGTSAVAPLWAALVARLVQSTGTPIGLAQPRLYGKTKKAADATGFRDITKGNNGAYKAGPGWDACTGLGVPNGTKLVPVF